LFSIFALIVEFIHIAEVMLKAFIFIFFKFKVSIFILCNLTHPPLFIKKINHP